MLYIKSAQYVDKYKIRVVFSDEVDKVVDLEGRLEGPIFAPLKDVDYFKTVKYSPELKTIYWENGADLAPEFLYQL